MGNRMNTGDDMEAIRERFAANIACTLMRYPCDPGVAGLRSAASTVEKSISLIMNLIGLGVSRTMVANLWHVCYSELLVSLKAPKGSLSLL